MSSPAYVRRCKQQLKVSAGLIISPWVQRERRQDPPQRLLNFVIVVVFCQTNSWDSGCSWRWLRWDGAERTLTTGRVTETQRWPTRSTSGCFCCLLCSYYSHLLEFGRQMSRAKLPHYSNRTYKSTGTNKEVEVRLSL